MLFRSDSKETYYQVIRELLIKNGLIVNPYREISYGLQFMVFEKKRAGMIRIYESKKGISIDFSQVKDERLLDTLSALIPDVSKPKKPKFKKSEPENPNEKGLTELIGIDESGKGDYFGPLVVAAAYVNADLKKCGSPLYFRNAGLDSVKIRLNWRGSVR